MSDAVWSTPEAKRVALQMVLAHLQEDEPVYMQLAEDLRVTDPQSHTSVIRWLTGMVVRSHAPEDGPFDDRPKRQQLAGMIRDELAQLEPPPPDFWRRQP
ncbi:hypothetical protein [Mycolicibacterium baixiangningiae]|uniref:hypothetical protein n=1 Tax=Mycolicibacterium baixiangningiae TaxID=2761578 RepID=UPI001868646E|nr:hypothetical protein [Mycolicibacterium baixiangningiae]